MKGLFPKFPVTTEAIIGDEDRKSWDPRAPITCHNHKNYNFLACDWFKIVLFSTNSLAKLLSDSLLLDSLLSDSLISQSHSKM